MSKKQIKINKSSVIEASRVSDKDTGSPQVQVALMTARINNLAAHLNGHKQDQHSRTGLLRLVGQRRRMIQFLERSSGKEEAMRVRKAVGMKE